MAILRLKVSNFPKVIQLLCGEAQTLIKGFQATFLILFLLWRAIGHGILVYLLYIKLWFVGYVDIILKAFEFFKTLT